MADIITGTTTGFVNNLPETTLKELSDTRREVASDTAAIQLENMKGFDRVNADVQRAELSGVSATKDARHDISSRLNTMQINQDDRFYDLGKQISDNTAQLTSLGVYIKDAATISAQSTQLAVAADGEKTRSLINDLKYQDLNRALIERNAELVEERHHAHRWHDRYEAGQWQALSNQMQAFQSQLATTTQGMVNFGTMAGVGQSSTSNNVR